MPTRGASVATVVGRRHGRDRDRLGGLHQAIRIADGVPKKSRVQRGYVTVTGTHGTGPCKRVDCVSLPRVTQLLEQGRA